MKGWIGHAATLVLPVALVGSVAAMVLSNNPIPGIDVVVKKKPNGGTQLVRTDAKGGFRLTGLTPGTYEITLEGRSLRSGVIKADRDPKSPDAVLVTVALLLPAVQKAREAAQRSVKYDAGGTPGSVSFTFDLPAACVVGRDRACTGKADYQGTVMLVPEATARMEEANSAMSDISTTR